MKYRKKPIVIEAEQFLGVDQPWPKGVLREPGGDARCFVQTAHNGQRVYLEPGDYIVPEPDGTHYYPCKPDIFEATYEPVERTKPMMTKELPTKELPRYKCHKEVHALKIKQVTKHALRCCDATPEQDAAFEENGAFEGAHLHFEDSPYPPRAVDADWYRKHDPEPGGYYVVYEDGYTSYSPAETFENGYTRIQ